MKLLKNFYLKKKKNLIQEDLPFIKTDKNLSQKKLIQPSILIYLKHLYKKKIDTNKNENNDPKFLEKILLDFEVNSIIKEVVMVLL